MQEEDLGKGVFKKTNVNFESILQKQREIEAVSYTHLTLPTTTIV